MRGKQASAQAVVYAVLAQALAAALVGRDFLVTGEPMVKQRHLDYANDEIDRLAIEVDSTYAHIRSVAENCKTATPEAIRAQLVGLLPEVRDMDEELKNRLLARGMGHLVERHAEMVRKNWADFGYPEGGSPS